MDERDIRILLAVGELGTSSIGRLADETGIPKSTIHYRINKLKEDGVITNELFDLNLEKIGLTITVITEVIADYGEDYHEKIGGDLNEIPGVNKIYWVMGDTDFVVISHVTDRQMLEKLFERFESIDGVRRTTSRFVIGTIKDEKHPLSTYSLDELMDIL